MNNKDDILKEIIEQLEKEINNSKKRYKKNTGRDIEDDTGEIKENLPNDFFAMFGMPVDIFPKELRNDLEKDSSEYKEDPIEFENPIEEIYPDDFDYPFAEGEYEDVFYYDPGCECEKCELVRELREEDRISREDFYDYSVLDDSRDMFTNKIINVDGYKNLIANDIIENLGQMSFNKMSAQNIYNEIIDVIDQNIDNLINDIVTGGNYSD